MKEKALAQVVSCEFCEISSNNSFYRTPLVAASELPLTKLKNLIKKYYLLIIINSLMSAHVFVNFWFFHHKKFLLFQLDLALRFICSG